MEWRSAKENIQGQKHHEMYVTGLPSGIHIQVANIDGEWYGFAYADTEYVYLTHEALEKTPPHTHLEDCKEDILERLRVTMREDLEVLNGVS